MIFALLSRRIRQYVVFALVIPLVGRVLEVLGVRVGARNPRAGQLLSQAGGYARRPMTRQQRLLAQRALRRRR